MKISPLAVVDPRAELAADVEVGPFCVVGPDVVIDAGTRLISHVSITGHTRVGRDNVFHPNAVIGGPPQDRKYRGGVTRIEIGNANVFREAVTIHVGTEKGGGVTRVGDNNLLMVNSHLGHDVQLGSHCTFANNVMIAGHVIIGDCVAMMGGVGIHHFVTVGEYAFLGGYSRIHHDVPPFTKVDGADEIRGLNIIGLRRAGFNDDDIDALEDAARRLFYRDKPLALAMADFDVMNGINTHVRRLIDFLRQRDRGKNGRYLESRRARA